MQSYWQFFCEPEQKGEFTPARTEDPASGDRSGWSCEPSAMDSGTASAGQGDRQSESNSDPLPCRACKKDGEGRGFGGSGFFFSEYDRPLLYGRYAASSERSDEAALLNTKAKLIGASDISVGTVNATLVSPRELFLEALKKNAVSIILLHNHPSGDPTPSQEDILLTQRVRKAGDLIGIELLDHIIIGDNRYISLREKGFFCGNPG